MTQFVKNVLLRERSTIQTNINRIEPHCTNGRGNRDMLNVQVEHLEMVEALLLVAHDPELTAQICHRWLRTAAQTHANASGGHFSDPQRNDLWWQSLDQIQYVSYLLNRIEAQTV
jgi:hypothetical protein